MGIAHLRTFNQAQLLHVLSQCAHSLAYAWEETQIDALFDVSCEATQACEYLRCTLAVNDKHFQLQ